MLCRNIISLFFHNGPLHKMISYLYIYKIFCFVNKALHNFPLWSVGQKLDNCLKNICSYDDNNNKTAICFESSSTYVFLEIIIEISNG